MGATFSCGIALGELLLLLLLLMLLMMLLLFFFVVVFVVVVFIHIHVLFSDPIQFLGLNTYYLAIRSQVGAIDAVCYHFGGPLDDAPIEDLIGPSGENHSCVIW